ncbi:GvpL/GvpF family gas vesicle protein [Nocardioides sp.]|uniref:GvpL/GvpF family gas vesicle protein n=1 Tax=Nocardioides sp. TaxID=35761 RepID=UPI0027343324|nr:GvpL/GvpF family gas vesicle protein [Nocardioides sp.]MDP3893128.1 GvpL/GvpF family gas vesicle protein [Nocardioides sp.]
MSESGRYLYAITRHITRADLAEVPALSGGELEVVEHRDLCAVVSTVPLEEYGEEGLRANLERLEWLEEVARRHDAVIHAVAAHGPTAPLRLATICLDDAGVRRRLDEWYYALLQVLERVEGRMEWSVKVMAPPLERVLTPATSSNSGGADYLRRKKDQQQARAAREDEVVGVAEQVHDVLSGLSVASRRLPAQDPRLTGHEGTMVLNGAYLVDASRGEAFAGEVQRCALDNPGLDIEWGGPWPPYSFAMLEQR